MQVNSQQFKIWHDKYQPRLLNSMTAVVRDREIAEDVTATALATAWQKLDQFRGEASLYTWVYRIALNEALQHASRKRTVSLDAMETPLKELTESDEMNGDEQKRASHRTKLRNALGRLPALHRRALVDHFVRGYPVKRIARQDGIPVGTVLSRIFTAKRLLRAAWESGT